jgi:hypothetical protein
MSSPVSDPGSHPKRDAQGEIVEVSGEPPDAESLEFGRLGRRSSRAVITVAGVAVAAGLVLVVGLGRFGPTEQTIPPSPVLARPSPSIAAAPSATPVPVELAPGIPATVDNLKVSTVAAALAAGPAGGARTVALGGYLSSNRAVEGCPPQPTTDKPDACGGTQLVLVDRPAVVLQPNDATFLYDIAVPADLPSIQPVVLPGTTVDDPWANATTLDDRLAARPVVLVGQLGDPRSPECAARPGGGNAGCDRSFVVQQLAWLDGLPTNPSVFVGPGLKPTKGWLDAYESALGWFLPKTQPAFVSISCLRASDAASLAGVNLDELGDQLVWVVHVVSSLADEPASSFLVFDDRSLSLLEVSP